MAKSFTVPAQGGASKFFLRTIFFDNGVTGVSVSN
jgi:hypothetical protein